MIMACLLSMYKAIGQLELMSSQPEVERGTCESVDGQEHEEHQGQFGPAALPHMLFRGGPECRPVDILWGRRPLGQ